MIYRSWAIKFGELKLPGKGRRICPPCKNVTASNSKSKGLLLDAAHRPQSAGGHCAGINRTASFGIVTDTLEPIAVSASATSPSFCWMIKMFRPLPISTS